MARFTCTRQFFLAIFLVLLLFKPHCQLLYVPPCPTSRVIISHRESTLLSFVHGSSLLTMFLLTLQGPRQALVVAICSINTIASLNCLTYLQLVTISARLQWWQSPSKYISLTSIVVVDVLILNHFPHWSSLTMSPQSNLGPLLSQRSPNHHYSHWYPPLYSQDTPPIGNILWSSNTNTLFDANSLALSNLPHMNVISHSLLPNPGYQQSMIDTDV